MIKLGYAAATAAALLAGAATALAQVPYAPYAPYPYQPYPPVSSAAPPAWHYNPYTSGLGPCPNRYPSEPPCRQTVDPSFGQPSYWVR